MNRLHATRKGQKGKNSKRAKKKESQDASVDKRSFEEYMRMVEPLERAADQAMAQVDDHDDMGEPVHCIS